MDVQVSAAGVILAAISSMAVGSIWYAKPVFGNIWIKLAKVKTNDDQGKMWALLPSNYGLLAMAGPYRSTHFDA
jgi:hypothetical protein